MPYELGGFNDQVRLKLGDDEIHVAESWEIVESILSQPAVWSLRLGNSTVAGEFIKRYPPRTPFELYIGGALQMSGHIDAIGASGTATQITIRGRDALAPMHDSGIDKLRSFKDGTYYDLTAWALEQVGLDPKKLIKTNLNNRNLKAGIPIDEIGQVVTNDVVLAQQTGTTSVGAIVHQEHQNAIQESALSFVRRHIDRAGLFLWATADGHFVLSLPNPNQKAAYRIIRRKDGKSTGANIVDYDFQNDCTNRHGGASVFARSGGKKHGRVVVTTATVDEEMFNWGYRTTSTYRDVNVQNKQQAAFFCDRKLAEERLAGWQLAYTIAGHTLPAIGASSERAILTPDTTIEVIDEVLGFEETFYIETVRRQRQSRTTTQIRLMRLGDLLFGNFEDAS